jgi:uncharacterized membrane protein YfhO
LVLSQIYYPGWQAAIDGARANLQPVNVIQQGVVVPAGRHTVEISFAPASFWWGSLLSAVGLLLAVGLLILGQIKRPR